jgi:hypothetical protein
VTHVEFRNLGDRAANALRACPWVEHVEFLRDDDDPLTAVGIAAVCALPKLRTLVVAEGNGIPADALRALGTARGLQVVHLLSDAVDDAVLVTLATLPALRELELVGCRSFGEVGMRAPRQHARSASARPPWLFAADHRTTGPGRRAAGPAAPAPCRSAEPARSRGDAAAEPGGPGGPRPGRWALHQQGDAGARAVWCVCAA